MMMMKKGPMILIEAPIPDYDDINEKFRYVIEWDLKTFPSPLEFVKSVAVDMRFDDVDGTFFFVNNSPSLF